MDTPASPEQQLRTEVERLRGEFPQTQDFYREVCVLLFFRHGVTPTANKLYQLVRKGSMSAPAEALSRFWADLREKSRVRIEHPDLPDDLKTAAGELTAALWARAQAAARDDLALQRRQAETAVLEAKAAQVAAEAALKATRQDMATVQESLRKADEQARLTDQRLAAEGATRAGLEGRLREASDELARAQSALNDARRDFGAELEKLRAAGDLVEERHQASEQRALQEIDRERTHAARLQKEVDHVRVGAGQAAERYRADLSAQQSEIGQMRQQLGALEGRLHAATLATERAGAEAQAIRSQLTDALGQVAALRVEADNWRAKAEEEQFALGAAWAKLERRERKRGGQAAGGES